MNVNAENIQNSVYGLSCLLINTYLTEPRDSACQRGDSSDQPLAYSDHLYTSLITQDLSYLDYVYTSRLQLCQTSIGETPVKIDVSTTM